MCKFARIQNYSLKAKEMAKGRGSEELIGIGQMDFGGDLAFLLGSFVINIMGPTKP